MEANEKTFRHSFVKAVPMFLVALFLGVLAFSVREINHLLFVMAGLVFVAALSSATSSLRSSGEEITTRGLLGSKSLRWSDIARVSTRGQALRLHSYDDLVLSIDSQLDGYKEILDIIFSKRPDLFDANEDNVMSSSWLLSLVMLGFGLFLVGLSIFLFFITEEFDRFFSLFLFVIGGSLIAGWLLSAKSLILESRSVTIGYLFREVTCSADDISSISLDRQRTKNGYVYFVHVDLVSGKKIKLSGFKYGAPLTYQILKRWREKASRFA